MRRGIVLILCWGATLGAFYEWGGAAARGVRELKKGEHRRAAGSLAEGRAELPRSAAVRYDQAIAYQGAGLVDSALAAYQEAARSPSLAGDAAKSAAAYNLGNESMRAQDYAGAARHFRESLRVDPKRVDAKKNLEEAIRRGRRQEPPPRKGGSSGSPESKGDKDQGKGQSGDTPPPKANEPGGEGRPGASDRQSDLGREIPDRSEAEHWLDALEGERQAARRRDRGGAEQERGQRDW